VAGKDDRPGRSRALPHHEFVELLVEDELARRADRLFGRRFKQAGNADRENPGRFDWTFNPKVPKNEDCRIGECRLHQHGRRRAPVRPARRQVARRHGHRHRRYPRRAPRPLREHLRLGRRLPPGTATGARRELVKQLTRVDLLALEDLGMKTSGSAQNHAAKVL
jgi:hypothetical protein